MRTIACAVALLTVLAVAADAAEEIHSVRPPLVAVCVLADGPIDVDGDLGDAAWDAAIVVGGLTVSAGDRLAPNQTAFAMVRDAEALYVGVLCMEETMQGLETKVTTRDGSVWHDDVIELFLDTNHDHESFCQFAANAIATRFDAKSGSSTWDTDWEAAASIEPDSWTLELRIPFASLGVEPPAVGEVWGMNLCRERQAGGDTVLHNWANVQGNFLRPWLFGHLYFAGESFELTDEVARAIHAAVEFPARVILADGWALATPDGAATGSTYQEMLAASFAEAGELKALHAELAAAYAEHEDAPFTDEFAPLDEGFGMLQAASQAPGLDSLGWAHRTVQIDALAARLLELKWKVRIALLLREA